MAKRKYMSKVDGKINVGEKHQAKIPELVVTDENGKDVVNTEMEEQVDAIVNDVRTNKRARVEDEIGSNAGEGAATSGEQLESEIADAIVGSNPNNVDNSNAVASNEGAGADANEVNAANAANATNDTNDTNAANHENHENDATQDTNAEETTANDVADTANTLNEDNQDDAGASNIAEASAGGNSNGDDVATPDDNADSAVTEEQNNDTNGSANEAATENVNEEAAPQENAE
ncbi:hypothetical protein PCYB_021570 [Plasmodium cynomolgi strain B]|uniref:ELM2 domain-containing protein n=1 Tax=Plasmodium cynomolgi (strain B) TaxID=1120755 RepID=K6UI19_PLACD|nr:hypothetical protein PCYB_021570 [Plasmodium cynomolgi strain B]GAB64588.1 hypothetical protein PCYB_021570 [Plasmodium cynomolgi strain B]